MSEIPAGAKQPQDRKPKKSAAQLEAENASIEVKYNGVSYSIERDTFDDVELLELIGDLTENTLLLPKVVHTILGDVQWAKFKDANRNDKGRVPNKCLGELFTIIDKAAGKSSASRAS